MVLNQTKLQEIPPDWSIETISNLSEVAVTNGLYKNKEHYGKGIKMIHMTELFAHDVIGNQDMPLVDLSEKEGKKYLLQNGDLVFARRSLKPEGAGDVSIVWPERLMSFESSIIRARLNKFAYPLFVFFYLKSVYGKAQMMTIVRHVAVSGITGEDLKRIQIPCPSLPEQKKIAQILSTWDKAITTTEQLLANSQQQKKALMQQLLTGKKRFPGFGEEWKDIRLKSVLKEGKARNRDNAVERVLSVTNHSGFVLPEEQFSKRVASNDVSNYKIVKKGQFGYNPSRINVGSFARLNQYDIGLLSPMYVVFSVDTKLLDSDYLNAWMSSNEAKQRINSSTQGSVRDSVGFDALCGFPFKLPALEEQQKISSVLSVIDREIEALKQKLNCLKQEKKALMQQLLTGKRRVAFNV